jgi:hypothetical protein
MANGQSLDAKLTGLGRDARARVETALKAAIERELAAEATGVSAGAVSAAKEFSKGWFFSRSRPVKSIDEELAFVQLAASMDEASFAKFAERLQSLRTLRDAESGGGR